MTTEPPRAEHGAPTHLQSRLRSIVRGSPLYAPIRRARLQNLVRRPGVYPDWTRLLAPVEKEWRAALERRSGPKILIATSLGLHFTANTVDTLIAVALTFRGARAETLLCDRALPACQMVDHVLAPSIDRYAREGPQPDFCEVCFTAGERAARVLGLPLRRLSDELTEDDRRAAKSWAETADAGDEAGARLAEHAHAGALRFFGRTHLRGDIDRPVHQRYREAAFLADRAATRLIEREKYSAVIAHHGIYAPQGPIADAAKRAAARLVVWHPSYRRGRLIFEHGDTYHRGMITEPASRWSRPLTAADEETLDAYLDSRMVGALDWITFQRAAPKTRADLETSLRLSFDKPTMILIGSVAWDARLHFPQSAYGEMTAWAADTARWFAARPHLQLVLRCHPGEVMSSPKAMDRLDDAVRAALPVLPPNVVMVPPESDLNTYAIARHCRAALVYNTKMAVELAARGMPVIVAGDAWIRGKGFSADASSPAEYAALLEGAATMPMLEGRRRDLARRYAYHFFFRRCVSVAAFDEEKGWPLCSLRADAGRLAMPGADEGLDVICNGVLRGAPFEYNGAANAPIAANGAGEAA